MSSSQNERTLGVEGLRGGGGGGGNEQGRTRGERGQNLGILRKRIF